VFLGARRVADPAAVAAMASDLPVYIAVGEADPVNGGQALLTPLTDRHAAAGLTDVTVRVYPAARHEILNETNRDDVIGEFMPPESINPPVLVELERLFAGMSRFRFQLDRTSWFG